MGKLPGPLSGSQPLSPGCNVITNWLDPPVVFIDPIGPVSLGWANTKSIGTNAIVIPKMARIATLTPVIIIMKFKFDGYAFYRFYSY